MVKWDELIGFVIIVDCMVLDGLSVCVVFLEMLEFEYCDDMGVGREELE